MIRSKIHLTSREYKMSTSDYLGSKKNGKLRFSANYKKLNNITKNDWYPFLFCDEVLEDEYIVNHCYEVFADICSEYHEVKTVPENQLNITFTSLWNTFCCEIMTFGVYNTSATFLRLMNKVLKPYLWHFVIVFMNNFGVYENRTSHLKKLEKIFERLDQ